MSATRMVKRGRVRATRLMESTVLAERPNGEAVFDPDTLQDRHEFVPVYEGRAKVQTYESHESSRELAGSTTTLVRLRIDFPVGAYIPKVADKITVLTNPPDPALAGMVAVIASIAPVKTYATAYRVFVDVIADA